MALKGSGIANDEFTVLINEEQIFFQVEKNIKAKDDQLIDVDRDRL